MLSYFKSFIKSIMENFCSVKVWFFIWPFIASTFYLSQVFVDNYSVIQEILKLPMTTDTSQLILNLMKQLSDTFIAWCTFNVSLVGAIIVVRETFKVNQLKALKTDCDQDKIKNLRP